MDQRKHKKRSKKPVGRILNILPILTLILPVYYIYVYRGIVLPKPNRISIYTGKTNITLKSYEYKHFRFKILKDTSHKYMYCNIAKNANTLFKTLFYALYKNDPTTAKVHVFDNRNKSDDNNIYIANNNEYKDILNDKTWQKLVIIRDPLERLLSAFLDKCLRCEEENCWYCDGGYTNNFTLYVERMIDEIENRNGRHLNHHFLPQHLYCDLYKTFQYYNKVIVYSKYTIVNDTINLLNSLDLIEYYNHWGKYHNKTMFEKQVHPTFDGQADKNAFYRKYFKTKQFADKCIQLFYYDYILFNLTIPQWVNFLD
eukprot:456228_1